MSVIVELPVFHSSRYVYNTTGILKTGQIETNDLFTPYGAYPLILHNTTRGVGLAWYANMLAGPRMQGFISNLGKILYIFQVLRVQLNPFGVTGR